MPVPISADDYYGRIAERVPGYGYDRPGQLRVEYLTSNRMRIATVPGEVLAEAIRPPAPQQLLPDRFGYSTEELTVGEVIATDRWAPQRRAWVSGGARQMFRDQARYSPEDQSWSGTNRNSIGDL
jgi:hypothetical protein